VSVALDHLVVAATSLDEGVAWCQNTLGITPGPGGKHPLMGTHNRLFNVSTEEFPNCFFEIIAIDPAAPPPGRPRWFGLDTLNLRHGPRLVHCVARSTMLDMHRWGLITVGQSPGDPLRASRDTPDGMLSWQILVRGDGQLHCGGALPTLMQWDGAHPADKMPPSGVTLKSLALHGVPERACDVLRLRGPSVQASGAPALQAVLATPNGDVSLESA
jgi:hypothetical protein